MCVYRLERQYPLAAPSKRVDGDLGTLFDRVSRTESTGGGWGSISGIADTNVVALLYRRIRIQPRNICIWCQDFSIILASKQDANPARHEKLDTAERDSVGEFALRIEPRSWLLKLDRSARWKATQMMASSRC